MRIADFLLSPAVFLALTGRTPVSGDISASFQPVGAMAQARAGAQATLLTDGTVLVTGGVDARGDALTPLASAELFDPTTNRFTNVGPMSHFHTLGHRAVRLQDGWVLVLGGEFDTATADLYDPATRRFTAAGSMAQERYVPTATLLADGRVLVTGGGDAALKPTATAELFDPVTGQFQATGEMAAPRSQHAAVGLPDGRVVILGGSGPADETLASVEIYAPKSGNFSPGGSLVEARTGMEAALLSDGRVLVVGGSNVSSPVPRQSIEVYDPATGQSAVVGSLSQPRTGFGLAPLSDGRFLVAGGSTGAPSFMVLGGAEIIDPYTGKSLPVAAMTGARSLPAATELVDGRVLVLGGLFPIGPVIFGASPGARSLDSAELFIPAGWSAQSP